MREACCDVASIPQTLTPESNEPRTFGISTLTTELQKRNTSIFGTLTAELKKRYGYKEWIRSGVEKDDQNGPSDGEILAVPYDFRSESPVATEFIMILSSDKELSLIACEAGS